MKGQIMEDTDMDIEYQILTILATKRMNLKRQLAYVDASIIRNSEIFFISDEGLIETGLGVC
jgi:hypothetical protein